MIDEKSLQKYRKFKGTFRNRLHNDIDWNEQAFRQYGRRCAFLNEENLCDIYSEAGKDMLCDTCRKYPRHIEEFEGLREYSLSLSCPEAAHIFLSHKEKITFVTREVPAPEETYDDFDYLLFTALMDTRDYLFSVIQDRSVPVRLRRQKLLACAHDFQLSLDKNELFQWEDIRNRHEKAEFGEKFKTKIQKWITKSDNTFTSEFIWKTTVPNDAFLLTLSKQIWKTVIPKMEVLHPGWHHYLRKTLIPLYSPCENDDMLMETYATFEKAYPDWSIQEEQLLLYWIYTYFCGAVYDDQIFAKVKMAIVCTFIIHELAVGTWIKNDHHFTFEDMISICYQFSRELEHSDPNLNEMERLMDEEDVFEFRNLLKL